MATKLTICEFTKTKDIFQVFSPWTHQSYLINQEIPDSGTEEFEISLKESCSLCCRRWDCAPQAFQTLSIGTFTTGIRYIYSFKEGCEDSDPKGLFCSQENTFLNLKESVGKRSYLKHWELKNLRCLVLKNLEDAYSTIMSVYLQLLKRLALSGAVEPSSRKTDPNAAPYDHALAVLDLK